VRTGLLLTAVVGVTALTGAGGYAAGELMLPRASAPSGIPSPLVSITVTVPSSTPTVLPPLPDVGGPDPLAAKQRFRARSFEARIAPPRTLYLDVPREWTEDNTYWLRVESVPDAPPDKQARDDLRGELQRNGTRDLKVLDSDSGTVQSRIDGTQRRYEELDYTFTDQNRRQLLVLTRWVDGIEISVIGRVKDEAGLRTVLERATQTARIDD
jgi:hypothetical protein